MADVDDMFGDEPIVLKPSLSEVNGDSKIDSGEQTPVVSVAEEDNRMETEEKVENGQSGTVVAAQEDAQKNGDDVMIIEDDDEQNGTASNGDAKKPEIEAYVSETNIVMVNNVTTKATEEQMSVLFSFIGPITEIALFPKYDVSLVQHKVCFVKFVSKADVVVALHLSNNVFIDRALQVKEWNDDWPDESEAIIYCTPQDVVKNMNLGDGLDATSTALTLFNNPRLMTTVNAQSADEFRRQVCVGNVHEIVTDEQVKQYFESYSGNVDRVEFHELRKGRKTEMDKDDVGHQVRYCTVIFADASSVGAALQLDGNMFAGIPISIKHTKYSDIKHDAAPDAMSKLDRDFGSKKKKSRTRSRSRNDSRSRSSRKSSSRRRSRSRDRDRSRRSRSRDHKKSSKKSRKR
ncbi:unnamed protein product [Oikopleura dioica]|uniref:RRM domain-containing protein n=1 Tax=Oikopleura dioica TaxID=34765 RepID=E4Y6D5_OIKDI|nr:unnamed protein product [Oikopleura dioica]